MVDRRHADAVDAIAHALLYRYRREYAEQQQPHPQRADEGHGRMVGNTRSHDHSPWKNEDFRFLGTPVSDALCALSTTGIRTLLQWHSDASHSILSLGDLLRSSIDSKRDRQP
ncbi:hypothetical protein [Xanthomonas oryzae]|uniref:hypothetical protein n=1 Tax=Xanthomonas oryzae TaxID=347 RepID=UPI00236869BD|nr:hypothetical protein [Xanthomonas oryzae]WDN28674.1 hypothetical protein LL928_02270 [Xanthomonas oryzae]